MIRDIGRDTPGAAPGLAKSSSKGGDFGARKRSMKGAGYYGEVFAVRETGPVVPASSGVWVELRTNVIVSIISSSSLCFAFGFAFTFVFSVARVTYKQLSMPFASLVSLRSVSSPGLRLQAYMWRDIYSLITSSISPSRCLS